MVVMDVNINGCNDQWLRIRIFDGCLMAFYGSRLADGWWFIAVMYPQQLDHTSSRIHGAKHTHADSCTHACTILHAHETCTCPVTAIVCTVDGPVVLFGFLA